MAKFIKCDCCDGYGKVEIETGRTWSGDYITAWSVCPKCKGEGEMIVPTKIETASVIERGSLLAK